MTDEETTAPELRVLANLNIDVREFTLEEMRILESIKQKHDVDGVARELNQAQTRAQLENRRADIDVARKVTAAIEKQIDKLVEKPNFNLEKLGELTEQLQAARDREASLVIADQPRVLEANQAEVKRLQGLMELQERVNLEVVHAVLKHRGVTVPPLADWLSAANVADRDFAAEFVETGRSADPLARIGNRAARRSKHSRDSN